MPGSWSDYLELRRGPAPPHSNEDGDVRVYADTGGSLRAVQSDGTDAPIGGGGGFTPVACVLLLSNPVDVSTVGNHPLLWDGLEDDVWNENTLTEIPDGLGLSFSFDGSDNTITTTAAGTWAFSITSIEQTIDLDWRGHYDDSLVVQSRFVQQAVADGPNPKDLTVGVVMTLPVGAQLGPRIVTDAAAGVLETFLATLMVTRLA